MSTQSESIKPKLPPGGNPPAGNNSSTTVVDNGSARVHSTQKVGSPINPCPVKVPVKCELLSLEIGPCKHQQTTGRWDSAASKNTGLSSKRSYKLILPEKDWRPPLALNDEYHVIAGDTKAPDELQVLVKIKKALCGEHSPRLLEIKQSPDPDIVTSSSSYKMRVYSHLLPDKLAHPFDFLRKAIWIGDIAPREYLVETNACYGHQPLRAVVKAFPDLQWTLKFAFGFTPKSNKQALNFVTPEKEVNHQALYKLKEEETTDQILLNASVTCHHNGEAISFSNEYKKYIQKVGEILYTAKKVADRVSGLVQEMGSVAFTLKYPNIVLEYNAGFAEHPKQYLVDKFWSFEFKGDPIFGWSGKADVLDGIIRLLKFAPPPYTPAGRIASDFLLKVKYRLAKGVGSSSGAASAKGVLSITAELKGDLKAGIKWEKPAGTQRVLVSGSAKLEIGGVLEGIAHAEGHVFKVAFKAGAKAGATMGVGLAFEGGDTLDKGPYVTGYPYFTGLVFYYAYYASLGSKAKPPKAPTKGRGGGEIRDIDHAVRSAKAEEIATNTDEGGVREEIRIWDEWPDPDTKKDWRHYFFE